MTVWAWQEDFSPLVLRNGDDSHLTENWESSAEMQRDYRLYELMDSEFENLVVRICTV